MWVLLPSGLSYRDVEVVAYQQDKPGMVEAIKPTYRFDMAAGSLFGGMMVAPLPNHTFECRWTWDDDCNALTHGADSPGRSLAVNSIRMTEPAPIAKPGNWEERPHRNKKTPRNSSFPELDTAKSYPTRTRT